MVQIIRNEVNDQEEMPDANMEKKETLEKLLYDDFPEEFPETYEEVLDFLNIDYFPSFRERLTNFLTERIPDHCKLTPEQFLKQQVKANACSAIPESTIRKWFSDGDRTSKTATTRTENIEMDRMVSKEDPDASMFYCIMHGEDWEAIVDSDTNMIAAGVDLVTTAGELGHANASTTATIYAHRIQEANAKAYAARSSVFDHRKKDPNTPREKQA